MAMSFEAWLAKVDRALLAEIGLTHRDLPDCDYAGMFEDEMSAREAAEEAIRLAVEF